MIGPHRQRLWQAPVYLVISHSIEPRVRNDAIRISCCRAQGCSLLQASNHPFVRREVFSALQTLHDLSVVHGDLHGGNILVQDTMQVTSGSRLRRVYSLPSDQYEYTYQEQQIATMSLSGGYVCPFVLDVTSKHLISSIERALCNHQHTQPQFLSRRCLSAFDVAVVL
jgi:hypothetical protein